MTAAEMAELSAMLNKPVVRWATSDGLQVAAGINWASLTHVNGKTLLRCSTINELCEFYQLLVSLNPKRNQEIARYRQQLEFGGATFTIGGDGYNYISKNGGDRLRILWVVYHDLCRWLANITGLDYEGNDQLEEVHIEHNRYRAAIRLKSSKVQIGISRLQRLGLQQALLRAAADPNTEVAEWRYELSGHTLLFHHDGDYCRLTHNQRGVPLYQADMARLALQLEPPVRE